MRSEVSLYIRSMYLNSIYFGRQAVPIWVLWGQSISYLGTWTLRVCGHGIWLAVLEAAPGERSVDLGNPPLKRRSHFRFGTILPASEVEAVANAF